MKDEADKVVQHEEPSGSDSSFILPPSSLPQVRLITTEPHPCSYLPGRMATNRAFWAERMSAETYRAFMDAGFRRSGKFVYQPACTACRKCLSLRVPVAQFSPSKSQRRCWRKNEDLVVTSQPAGAPDEERFALYQKYIRDWHGKQPDAETSIKESYESFVSFLYDSPVPTTEYAYRDPAGRLLAIGICDLSDAALSTVYLYHDPAESKRGLGTFAALYEIGEAKRLGLGYYYLGYWVDGCPTMAYKAAYRPHELLQWDGRWKSAERDAGA